MDKNALRSLLKRAKRHVASQERYRFYPLYSILFPVLLYVTVKWPLDWGVLEAWAAHPWIVVLDKALSVIVWVVMLAPAFVITYLLPSSLAGWGGTFAFVTAILLAANVRGAFLKPLFLTMVMIKFHVCVEKQSINETWDERLTSVSRKFQEIKDKALGFGESASQPATK